MELTIHGLERIYGRTKMLPEDVLSIVSSGAAVPLGSDEEYAFHLFYSPPDRQVKIAVISKSGSHLVSVWKASYLLPAGVSRVTPRHEKAARSAMSDFLFKKLRETARQGTPTHLAARIEVRVGRKVEFVRDCGEIPISIASDYQTVVTGLYPQLAEIARLIEEHKHLVNGKQVGYTILFSRPGVPKPVLRSFTVSHAKFVSRLLQAA